MLEIQKKKFSDLRFFIRYTIPNSGKSSWLMTENECWLCSWYGNTVMVDRIAGKINLQKSINSVDWKTYGHKSMGECDGFFFIFCEKLIYRHECACTKPEWNIRFNLVLEASGKSYLWTKVCFYVQSWPSIWSAILLKLFAHRAETMKRLLMDPFHSVHTSNYASPFRPRNY